MSVMGCISVYDVQYINICGLWVVFLAMWVVYLPLPLPLNREREIWAAFSKIFFEILFFYFCITIIHQPVGVVSSFAGFFRVKGLIFDIFLGCRVGFDLRLLIFGYF